MPADPKPASMPTLDRIEGWKDIGSYLRVSARTAQRWEQKEHLPVHREGEKVFAYPPELDRWRAARIVSPQETADAESPVVEIAGRPGTLHRQAWLGLCLLAAVGALLAWQYWPKEIRILAYRVITRDGRQKIPRVFTDGQKVYFNEIRQNQSLIASVPRSGGPVSLLPVPQGIIHSLSLARHSLLISGPEYFGLFELELETLKSREIPLPVNFSPGIAFWNPAGTRIAVAGESWLGIFKPWRTDKPAVFQLHGLVQDIVWDRSGGGLRFSVLNTRSEATQWFELPEGSTAARQLPNFSTSPMERAGAWSNDGVFAFECRNGVVNRVCIAEGGRAYSFPPDGRDWHFPTFLLGSSTVLAVAGSSQGQLATLTGDPLTGNSVLPGIQAYELDYSRDGQWVAYTLYPEHTIWRSRIDGSEPRQLTPSRMQAHQPHWSPDGRSVAFMGKPANGGLSHIFIVPALGGSLYEALPSAGAQGVPTWSADGQSLTYGDHREVPGFAGATIHQLNLQTGVVSDIAAPTGMWSPRVSPDSRYIVAVSYDNRSLYMRDNLRKTWQKCLDANFVAEPAWLPNSSMIQFEAIIEPAPPALFRIGLGCEDTKKIVDLAPYRFLGDGWFGVTPHGQPMGLLRVAEEIYTIEWRLRRRFP